MISSDSGESYPDWDEFVRRTPGGDLDQSTLWSRFRRSVGFECHRIVAREGTRIVGGAQLYTRRVGPWGLAYVPYGPLVAPEASEGVVHDLVQALMHDVSHRGAVFIQPPLHGERVAAGLSACGFTPSQVQVAPSATLRLNVSRPVEELERGLSRMIRPYVRRWQQIGVEVRRGTREDLGLLAELHALSAQHQRFTPMSLTYLEHLWDALDPGEHVRVFVGSVDKEPIAADLFASFGGVLSHRIKGFDREGPHSKARVPAAVVWTAIVDAHDRGERWLDFGGIARPAATAMLEERHDADASKARHRFKLAFGGRPVVYPTTVELIPDPALRAGLAITRSVKPGRRVIHRYTGHIRMGTSTGVGIGS